MQLDVRLPIGLMFSVFGVILSGYGLLGDPKIHQQQPLQININLYWGLVLLAFGLVMLFLVARAKKHPAA